MTQQISVTIENGKLVVTAVGGSFAFVPDVPPPPPPPPPPDPAPDRIGIWIGRDEIMALPTSGAGWDEVQAAKKAATGATSLSNQDSPDSTRVLACAYVYARTGDAASLSRVIKAVTDIVTKNLESGTRALALGRELLAYVVAADVVGLKTINADLHARFCNKLRYLQTYPTTQAGSLIQCSETRPNNWGGHAMASRVAVALYLGDVADLAGAYKVFRGWLGDWNSYHDFEYGDLAWQADKAKPVGINLLGSVINGHLVEGSLPEELRRGTATFTWPPPPTDYCWEGLQGPVAAAEMFERAGLPTWSLVDKALYRAVRFLYDIDWPAEGDDRWQIAIINRAYGTNFQASGGIGGCGKNIGWTLWTHQ